MFMIDGDEAIKRIFDMEREGKISIDARIELEQVIDRLPPAGSITDDYIEINLPNGTLLYIPDDSGIRWEVWYERHRGE